eukprot:g29773.t1
MGMNIESGLETRRPAFFYKFTLLLLLGSALVSVVLKTLVSRRLSRQANSLLPSSSWRSRRGREALPETGGPLSGKA